MAHRSLCRLYMSTNIGLNSTELGEVVLFWTFQGTALEKTNGKLSEPVWLGSVEKMLPFQREQEWNRYLHRKDLRPTESLAGLTGEDLSLLKAVSIKLVKVAPSWKTTVFQSQQWLQGTWTKKKKRPGKMTPSKEHKKLPVTNPKELEIYELPDKEPK